MEKQKEKNTKRHTEYDLDTVRKDKINAAELLHEIEFLLKDCFICKFENNVNELQMKFINGQRFKLIIEE